MNRLRQLFAVMARYGIFVALGIEFVLFSFLSPHFLDGGNQLNVLHQNAPALVLAVGMTLVILTAGIDLSVGSVLALTAVTAAQVAVVDWGPVGLRIPVALATACVLGAACGGINGFVITGLRIPPFVATLAMMLIAKGTVMIATKARTISGLPDEFGEIGAGSYPNAW
ncbi:MAG: ABC transporter permease, partial [Planctomycetota bacterium]